MHTLTGAANAVAIPAALDRKQERARRRLHQASERQVGHEADGDCTYEVTGCVYCGGAWSPAGTIGTGEQSI